MTPDDTTPTDGSHRHVDQTDWLVDYDDVAPIRIRDPVAEALGVVAPGDPLVLDYRDVVKAAGHSCPTAAGAYRIAQLGLDALYPDGLPVRGDIAVAAAGPKDDQQYGVTARLVSYVTGAGEEDGFGGLAGGHGGRRDLLSYDAVDHDGASVAFALERRDDADGGDASGRVRVTYDVASVPGPGPAGDLLPKMIDGSASSTDRETFGEAWHGRVRTVLTDDGLFAVKESDAA